jgi:7-cyano-7-deazaguanine synthase in queuosine biosynthesis
MSRKSLDNKNALRSAICRHVGNLFPDCYAEFCGQQGSAKKVGRTFGFRVKHRTTGKYKSNIVWVDPNYNGDVTEAWVASVTSR